VFFMLKEIRKFFLDIFFPKKCFGCQKEGNFLCKNCRNKIPIFSNYFCPLCTKKLSSPAACLACLRKTHISSLYVVSDYRNKIVASCIHAFKFYGITDLADEFYYLFALYNTKKKLLALGIDYILPVPLHPVRYRRRGYNQSEILSKIIGRQLDIQVRTDLLFKKNNTAPQRSLTKERRNTSLYGSFFTVNKDHIQGKNILLVDDVVTTGSTIQMCAQTLKKCGAKHVFCLVLAKS